MSARERNGYVGRFAPSPTGPLHFGSLLAAVVSFLEARRAGGRWLLRIEDIDPPREQPGATEAIVRCLEDYGFEWDGELLLQSDSRDLHDAAIERLMDRGLAYRCSCSRRMLAGAPTGPLGTIYPGTCRDRQVTGESAIRVRTDDKPIRFEDRLQGWVEQRLQSESGDYVIRRRDALVAYQLAVVVDDAANGVTDIVRGLDLLDSTPRQIYLQGLLGLPTPSYAHLPIAVHDDGQKLSKLTGAPAIESARAAATLHRALSVLAQTPPVELAASPTEEVWRWAQANWDPSRIVGRRSIAVQHYS